MARSTTATEAIRAHDRASRRRGRVRVGEECLELDAASPQEATVIRRFMGRVNGPSYPQPYLVEGPPGHFRLYVGDSAERVRTARGIQ